MCDVSGKNTQIDDENGRRGVLLHLEPGDLIMSNSDGQSCTTSKCSLCCIIFAIVHLLVLTCIAASLWNIDDAILASKGIG